MIIDLITGTGSNKEHAVYYRNEERVFVETTDLLRAIYVARLEATSFQRDAWVRIIVGAGSGVELTLLVPPQALVPLTFIMLGLHAITRLLLAASRAFSHLELTVNARPHGLSLLSDDSQEGLRTCDGCNNSQPAAIFQSRGTCTACENETCNICGDGFGYCLNPVCIDILGRPEEVPAPLDGIPAYLRSDGHLTE